MIHVYIYIYMYVSSICISFYLYMYTVHQDIYVYLYVLLAGSRRVPHQKSNAAANHCIGKERNLPLSHAHHLSTDWVQSSCFEDNLHLLLYRKLIITVTCPTCLLFSLCHMLSSCHLHKVLAPFGRLLKYLSIHEEFNWATVYGFCVESSNNSRWLSINATEEPKGNAGSAHWKDLDVDVEISLGKHSKLGKKNHIRGVCTIRQICIYIYAYLIYLYLIYSIFIQNICIHNTYV